MEDDLFPSFPEDEKSINEAKEPKIFDVTEEELDSRDCWPDCSPCTPRDDCSPDVVCSPEMKDCWPSCKPCSPNGVTRLDVEEYQSGLNDGCWPNCSPCSPDDFCAPDYDEGGK